MGLATDMIELVEDSHSVTKTELEKYGWQEGEQDTFTHKDHPRHEIFVNNGGGIVHYSNIKGKAYYPVRVIPTKVGKHLQNFHSVHGG
jgi:hypothetical protein